jgi:hypothetical protein
MISNREAEAEAPLLALQHGHGADSFQPPASYKVFLPTVPAWKLRSIAAYKRAQVQAQAQARRAAEHAQGQGLADAQRKAPDVSVPGGAATAPRVWDASAALAEAEAGGMGAGLAVPRARKSKLKALAARLGHGDAEGAAEDDERADKEATPAAPSAGTAEAQAQAQAQQAEGRVALPAFSDPAAVRRHAAMMQEAVTVGSGEIAGFERSRKVLLWLLEKAVLLDTQRNHTRGSTRSAEMDDFQPRKKTRIHAKDEE